jgi:hypothetical protein
MNPLVLGSVLLGLSLPLEAQTQVRALFIGNSFTFGLSDSQDMTQAAGGIPGIFDRLAQAGGQGDPTTVMRADPSVDFQFHDSNATTLDSIASQPWTHVILQNFSTEPTHYVDGSHSIADHLNYGASLYRRILTNNPATQVILYETWSRAAANTTYITGVSGPQTFASTTEMQLELRTNYATLAARLNADHPSNPPVLVAPVGDAWQNAGGLRSAADPQFVDLFASDHYHGNDNGHYLAAAVIYSVIYQVSPHGLSSNALISSLNLNFTVPPATLEDAAWLTVNSAAPAEPLKFVSPYRTNGQLVLTWTGNGQLELASTLPGFWIPIAGATNSPFSIGMTNTSGFFRLQQISP